jgi:hypothetical protein
MTQAEQVRVRELVAWGLDQNAFRPQIDTLPMKIDHARNKVATRDGFILNEPTLRNISASAREFLVRQLHRADLHAEMKELDWTTGIVDLRQLLAFQRRLVFDDHFHSAYLPSPEDWATLAALAFGPSVPITYRMLASTESELLLQSENPNLQIRASTQPSHLSLLLHGGSPFFEVAEFGGRWFLRDGYHRAYRLVCGGIVNFPAVIIRARTFAELGPVHPWFFPEETLFSSHPPRVIDFLDDNLTIEYNRPRLFKTFRVTIEESVEPALFTSNSGEQQ